MSSRWAVSKDADQAITAQRKRQKEEKRRAREQKQKETAEQQEQQAQRSVEPPTKRRRTEATSLEGASLLPQTNPSFGQSRGLELYDILNNIEEGSYGFVSRARENPTGEIVALKRLKIEHGNNEGFPVTGLREIQTLRVCSHPHIVHLREVVVGPGPMQDVYLVMDFLEHDLKALLEDMDEPFSSSETKTLMLQISSATEYLHKNWILHRDLKTSNLLLNNRGEIKIADFGMARYTASPPPRLTQLVVTLWYRAPELLLGAEEYGFEIDIWSMGCIFSELLTREPIFQGKNEVGQLSAIFSLLGIPTPATWPAFKSLPNSKALYPLLGTTRNPTSQLNSSKYPDLTEAGIQLLASMLTLNPEGRPSASEILSHPYFREDPRPKPKQMFPTFPSKAGQEKRRRRATPRAPNRGEAPRLPAEDFTSIFAGHDSKH
ncbi:hypothetical protein LTS08_004228 [Lithohypha guttulata]|uniref:uncharacterized protein n=1 Tax=Lithohypha guttulata TaxID=1690604 RepID=UPI002DDF8BFB|nr:hypothetical protein LTR51_005785 [Lithohypha guttulata]KAK5101769.1 hypothetical protein LTS08_004228 [Lithohypha guttulata]